MHLLARIAIRLAAAASLGLALCASPAHAAYVVTNVVAPAFPTFTQLLGINNAGTIAGFQGALAAQGFTLTLPGNFTPENFPGAASTQVVGINAAGDTAGIYVDAGGVTHGFTRIGGTFATIDQPGTAFNQALGINSANVTVGYSSTDPAGQVNQMAYLQGGGFFTNINPFLPANQNSQATSINNGGSLVGFYMPTATTSVGFRQVGGVISTVDPFGSPFTQALGINNNGDIVGFYTDPASGAQRGYIDIGGVFTNFDPPGSFNTTINGINDLGQIVGFFTDGNDNVVGFVGTPTATKIPEPGALSLTLLGLVALGANRRRLNGLGGSKQ